MNKEEILKLINSCKTDLKTVSIFAQAGQLTIESAVKLESVRSALDKIETYIVTKETKHELESHYTY